MGITRRDFLSAATALAASLGMPLSTARAAGAALPKVVWLQGQTCSGCSVSLLNYINSLGTIDSLLTGVISLEYHATVMAAAGDMAKAAAEAVKSTTGYFLVVEGAIPTGAAERCCYVWPGTTVKAAVEQYAANAAGILAVGTCAAFGGLCAATPNPTQAKSVYAVLGNGTGNSTKVINVPGCPMHPDWLVGTLAMLLGGTTPTLDSTRRPTAYFAAHIHECQFKDVWCLKEQGCRGEKGDRRPHGDCGTRLWNAKNTTDKSGVNWCIQAGYPCIGCTESNFPDSLPFYTPAAPEH